MASNEVWSGQYAWLITFATRIASTDLLVADDASLTGGGASMGVTVSETQAVSSLQADEVQVRSKAFQPQHPITNTCIALFRHAWTHTD